MIYAVEALNFRCLKYIYQKLHPFQVLVGPNASGKTTFLDTISFLADIVKSDIHTAIHKRGSTFDDLTFCGKGGTIEIALEAELPESIREKIFNSEFRYLRYEIMIGIHKDSGEIGILEEQAYFFIEDAIKDENEWQTRNLFPSFYMHDNKIIKKRKLHGGVYRSIVIKNPKTRKDRYYDETSKQAGKGWMPSFNFGIKKSALGNLPADETMFPAASWLKKLLIQGIQVFILDSINMRNASPPGFGHSFKTDGSNLPWVIEELKKNARDYTRWIMHLKTALPDIDDIEIIERPEDKHKYIKILYTNGSRIPSWLISDGTLRLLALTIIAYLKDLQGIFLIEEPENGIHPKAIETMYQSLSSVYNAQILLASHSPVMLSMVELKNLLCFGKTNEGITDIVIGTEHPQLKNWKGEVNLGDLFAGGILG